MRNVTAAGNTVVPGLLALEEIGFQVLVDHMESRQFVIATRGDERYSADDPITVLGLIKLVQIRGWQWTATDSQIDQTIRKYPLTQSEHGE
jgi:hypothetical protein